RHQGRGGGVACLVTQGHVFVGAHFDQATDGARKFLAVGTFAVQLLRRNRCRQQQLYPMIVENVDEPGEAPGRVGVVRRKLRDIRDDDDREATGKLEVVELRARTL